MFMCGPIIAALIIILILGPLVHCFHAPNGVPTGYFTFAPQAKSHPALT